MAKRLSPSDLLFLYAESRETMNHVASMMPFTPPEDAPPDWLRHLFDEIRDCKLFPPWSLKLKTPDFMKNPVQHWIEDGHPDLDYHVRRSALPSPGDERELGVLVSRLHGNPIDFHHPPWETHFIEGLEGGRFALYTKLHHSLIDGFTGNRLLQKSMSTDPGELDTPLFFAQHHPPPEREPSGGDGGWSGLVGKLREQLDAARDVGNALRDVWRAARAHDTDLVSPLQAPRSILNVRIGRNRRIATQRYSLEQVKAIAKAAGGTLNDVVLALSAGALRRFLHERNALPDKPLVAMIPVSVRPRDDPGGGNAVGSILASLATDLEDPAARLDAIMASTRRAKEQLQGLSKNAILQLTAVMLLPSGLQHITGTSGIVRPQFNVVISNVPGPDKPLYFRGAQLEAVYPLSIPVHGQALNITCQSYAGTLDFGFTGCRDSLPHMQRLAVYMGETLTQLSAAYGVS